MVKKVLIIGGVAGGASTAARLRRLDEFAEIIILERGPYVSFANCGLPYYIGRIIEKQDALVLQTPVDFLNKFNIDVRVNNEAISIDRKNKEVHVKDLRDGDEYKLPYDTLVLSPGAYPIRPNFEGIESVPVFTLRNIPDTMKIEEFITNTNPTSAVVIGGGYIGLEMAENLSIRGIRVTIVELLDQVIPTFDKEMAQFINNEITLNRIKLVLSDGVKSFSVNAVDCIGKYCVKTQSGKNIDADLIILSIGVRPESHLAKEAGLELTERGFIVVNKHMQTSDEDIYAVGDVIQITNFITNEFTAVPLAGPANRQGRIAADNIAGRDVEYKGVLGTAVLQVFNQTAAQTGLTEKQLVKTDIKFEKIYIHPKNHAGYYPEAFPVHIKLLYELETGKILGAQAFGGEGAEKRIDVISTVIYFGGTVYDLQDLELSYAPPFGSARDAVNMAGFVASNVHMGDLKIWHWHNAEKISKENGTIIDVRSPEDFEQGSIPGAINIPLQLIRSRLNEIPKDKPVYFCCMVGFTAYLACKILQAHGYDARNLTGGYQTYELAYLPPGEHVGELKPFDPQRH
ncbi:MAG: FAD-dependent oxidoreductase [Candidatus Heimdallarchaeaceae archaeon]